MKIAYITSTGEHRLYSPAGDGPMRVKDITACICGRCCDSTDAMILPDLGDYLARVLGSDQIAINWITSMQKNYQAN